MPVLMRTPTSYTWVSVKCLPWTKWPFRGQFTHRGGGPSFLSLFDMLIYFIMDTYKKNMAHTLQDKCICCQWPIVPILWTLTFRSISILAGKWLLQNFHYSCVHSALTAPSLALSATFMLTIHKALTVLSQNVHLRSPSV